MRPAFSSAQNSPVPSLRPHQTINRKSLIMTSTDFTALMSSLSASAKGPETADTPEPAGTRAPDGQPAGSPPLSVVIPDDWMQGRTTYGGLSAALCLEGVGRAFQDLPPLRSAQISFVGPVGGRVSVTASLLRAGRSVTFARGDLSGDKGLATSATFAFGGARASQFDEDFMPAPDLPGPDACAVFIPDGFGPPFARHYEQRLARGGRPMTGSDAHDHFIWVRHRDRDANGLVALLALADMPPPAMMPKFRESAPVSSMTWMVNFLQDDSQSEDGWYLLQSRAEHARAGYSSQDMLVWDRAGRPLIAGRQSVAIFI